MALSSQFESYFEILEEQSKPVPNDARQARYCEYITRFASYFSKERWSLTGSTITRMRLRSHADEGDYDYLIISGISIPVAALEHRRDVPCFVHIRTDKMGTSVFDDPQKDRKYLHSKLLKEVDKRVFEITSGLLPILIAPSASQNHIGLNRDVHPGTSQVNYFGINNINSSFESAVRNTDLSENTKTLLCGLSEFLGGSLPSILGTLIEAVVLSENVSPSSPKRICLRETGETSVRADYKSSKDFIAAFAVDGKLQCMDDWKKRMDNRKNCFWPKEETVDRIYTSEVYVVAKPAIISPDISKDFCLGFNQAERLLAESLNPDQRLCMLLLKSLQKGFLNQYSDVLTSFHWNTAFYHTCEEIDPVLFNRKSILKALGKVLSYMIECLGKGYLKHYFVESNLIAHISRKDAQEIAEKITKISKDQANALKFYFTKEVCTDNISISDEDLSRCADQTDVVFQAAGLVDLWKQLRDAASAENSKLTRALLDTLLLVLQKETGFLESDTSLAILDVVIKGVHSFLASVFAKR